MARKSLPPLLAFFPPLLLAQVRRPSLGSHNVNFEGLADGSAEGTTRICDLSEGRPLSNEYAAKLAAFSGPGFGALNGGVPAHACSLWDGLIPPLGNHSFDGLGFLAFSTIAVFYGRTGKPIAPETIRFDVRVTNMRIAFAGIDNHDAVVELWSGAYTSYNDRGVLLRTYRLRMTENLQTFDLTDDNVRALHGHHSLASLFFALEWRVSPLLTLSRSFGSSLSRTGPVRRLHSAHRGLFGCQGLCNGQSLL